jgi:methylmalonyl-CoA mutase
MSDTHPAGPLPPAPERLLAEFPPVNREEWRKLVEAELKGAPFDKRMLTVTPEGITLQPLYTPEDTAKLPFVNSFPGFAPFVRGGRASGAVKQGWEISQEIVCASPTEFNHAARNYLGRGLTALNMVLDQATRNGADPDWGQAESVGQGGLSIASLEDLTRALDGVDLAAAPLYIRTGASALPFAALLVALARLRQAELTQLRGCVEMDPLGVMAHEGRLPQSLAGAYAEMATLTRWAATNAPQLQTICVHSRAWHESGANAVQELAYALATAVEYLRAMNERGLDANTVAPRVRFAITVGETFFTEIAKLRALRMLWARVVQSLGGNAEAQRLSLHVRTSHWNKTVNDPYNNLLRTTVESFAAVLGSCDSLQVGAFDEVLRTPDEFSQRVARNTQIILQKECNLDRVIDPAGGSYFIESLTGELATRAWALFQEIEQQGGMSAALQAGGPQQAVAATAAARLKGVAQRRDSIVGVNQYANPKEQPLEIPVVDHAAFARRRAQQVAAQRTSLDQGAAQAVLEKLAQVLAQPGEGLFEACVEAAQAGATLGEITRVLRASDTAPATITPVCITRAAKPFEQLRAAMDVFASKTGNRPQVFLLNMGPLKQHKARADFSRGFLATGGYEVTSPKGFNTPDEAIAAFAKSGARVAVICSTDDTYPALVPALVSGLRAQKPDALVLLAGYPTEHLAAFKAAGIHDFIHLRANAAELLAQLHQTLGITA